MHLNSLESSIGRLSRCLRFAKNSKEVMSMRSPTPIILQAEPEPLEIDPGRTTVIVVDMQNAFISKGGYADLCGRDIPSRQRIIAPINEIADTARATSWKVIYTLQQHSPDLRELGGPNSSRWYKSRAAREYREHPELREKLLARGTWGAEIVEELKPQEGDIVVEKARFSAFFETNLDSILKTFDAKYLVFVGVTTNCCVEATIRDADNRGYFAILVSDATAPNGPQSVQEASIFNIKTFFGWVTTTKDILHVMRYSLVK